MNCEHCYWHEKCIDAGSVTNCEDYYPTNLDEQLDYEEEQHNNFVTNMANEISNKGMTEFTSAYTMVMYERAANIAENDE